MASLQLPVPGPKLPDTKQLSMTGTQVLVLSPQDIWGERFLIGKSKGQWKERYNLETKLENRNCGAHK